ncbi:hypothetical protein FB451DRAFT_1231562 [Mycena latifolia]|nr:hypothetical protein FB451DRAFT_1231562 [Mycena latifolia]
MSSSGNPLAASSSPQQRGGATSQALQPSVSNSDWLATSLVTAKAVMAGAECLPFPYVKGVFGMVMAILETIEKVKKNQEDLKELCGIIMEIIKTIQDQLSSHGDTAVVKFKGLCENLEGVLQDILKAVKQLQKEPRGFSGWFKEIVKLNSTTDEISGHQMKIQELRLNFLVHMIHLHDAA